MKWMLWVYTFRCTMLGLSDRCAASEVGLAARTAFQLARAGRLEFAHALVICPGMWRGGRRPARALQGVWRGEGERWFGRGLYGVDEEMVAPTWWGSRRQDRL